MFQPLIRPDDSIISFVSGDAALNDSSSVTTAHPDDITVSCSSASALNDASTVQAAHPDD